MDMNRAAVFAKVVEARGFSAAGRLLAMPKTTVSKKVSDLEAELGVRLLNRTTRQLSLTEAGERVYAHCVAAIQHMDQAEREARALQNEPEGMLTIAAPGAIAVPFLVAAVTAFMARYPAVRVTLLSVNDIVDFDKDRVDIMIWPGPSPPRGHTMRLVARVEIALYASACYVERNGMPTTPPELARHEVIAFTQSMSRNRFSWDLERDNARLEIVPSAQPRFRSNDATAVLLAVAGGHGIGGLPTRFVAEIPQGRALVAILPDWRVPPLELSALFPDASSIKTRLFLDFVAGWFKRI